MRTDSRIGGGASAPVYRHPLVSCISVFLRGLSGLIDPSVTRRVGWTPQAASTAAVLMALDADGALQDRFQHARACLGHDFRRRRRPGTTYNGLLKALERQRDSVLPILKSELRGQVRRRLKSIDPTGGWLLLAVDGSKEDLPRTRDQEEVFGIADNGAYPQAFLTAIVEVHTGLPWDWRIDRARASEKKHLMAMSADLPDNAMLLADGAFTGLPIWAKLHAEGKSFLIRVGGNVQLITTLWPQVPTHRERDIVYVWPQHRRTTAAPLKLRLLQVGSGSQAIYLLTNVLDPQRLSRKTAGAIYRKRWGVELFYRTLKRTLGRAKLRSKVARRATLELEWTMLAMTIVTLVGIDALKQRRRDPRRLSPASLIRALRNALRREEATDARAHRTLHRTLQESLRDDYPRRAAKTSRHRAVTRNTPKTLNPRHPIVRPATPKERLQAIKYWHDLAA